MPTEVILASQPQDMALGWAANSTSGSFTARSDTATEPATAANGLSVMDPDGAAAIMIVPFGEGADTNTFDLRVYGIARAVSGATTNWLFNIIVQLNCTLSSKAGLANGVIDDNQLWVDTIAVDTSFPGNRQHVVVSPGTELHAYAIVNTLGFSQIGVDSDITGATNANFLWKRVF